MSIATAITNLQGKIANAYTAIQNKGGTLPQVQNAENLSATIDVIPSGGSTPKWGFTSLEEVCYTDADGDFWPFNGISGTSLNFTGVKSINKGNLRDTFSGNTTVLSVSFPDLSSVGDNVLNRTFANSKIRSASFPELIGSSGTLNYTSAFLSCFDLSSVSFPKLKETRGSCFSDTFTDCSSLVSVAFPALSSGTGYQAFNRAFRNCTGLTSVSIPNLSSGNTSCFSYAFQNCTSLTSVDFSNLSLTIGKFMFTYAFQNCTSLESVSFPTLVTANGDNPFDGAFAGCTSLTSVSMPNLTGHGQNAFKRMLSGCTSLREVPSFLANLSSVNGYECLYATFAGCTSLSSASFPMLTSLVVTGTQASGMMERSFMDCTSLTSISFPELLSAGHTCTFRNMLSGCSSLVSASFPKLEYLSGNNICAGTFTNCTSLTSISFPMLTSITGSNALSGMFNGCSALSEIHFKTGADSVITAQTDYGNNFGATNATIYFDL